MSVDPQAFVLETLLWTGALIALVLIVRRPVAHHFGPRAAYALWTLPFARLVMPPIVLPGEVGAAPTPAAVSAVPLPLGSYTPAEAGGGGLLMQPMVASPPPVDWTMLALAVWLAGALLVLALRYWHYFAMRRALLDQGHEVGMRGRVRLIETPATAAPVAFGVFDKVIALPTGFMERTEPTRRDLALAHELAHHRAHDLLANTLVQPLFAIHWFNPLGWVGWRAMRRDQEAACDARVVDRCDANLREAYATTIASFATGTGRSGSVALAAPMACPVLGDKSIIQRLRSLTMADISPRRRFAGRALTVCAVAALPLTASISYAEPALAPQEPAVPAAPTAPAAPSAPTAPPAPPAPRAAIGAVFELSDDGDAGDEKRVVRVERTVVRDGSGEPAERTSYTINGRQATAEERAKIEAQFSDLHDLDTDMEDMRRELRVLHEKLGEGGELHRELEKVRREFGESGTFDSEIRAALAQARVEMPELRFECDGSDQTVQERVGPDGKRVMTICRTAGLANARSALAQARRAVERDRRLSERERAQALRSLDAASREIGSVN